MSLGLELCSWVAAVALSGIRCRVPARVARLAGDAVDPPRSAARRRILLVVTAASAASIHLGLAFATLAVPPLVARWRVLRAAKRTSARLSASMPELVELVAAGIAAGCTARHAVLSARRAAPGALRPALDRLATRIDRGERFADALERFSRDVGEPARSFVNALRAHERDGVPLGPTLERVAADARRQRRQQAEAAIRRLPVRLSVPLVTCTLTAFVVLTVVPLGAATFRSLQQELPAASHPLPEVTP